LATIVARNIRAARLAAQLTQRQLADVVGVETMAVSRWERAWHRPKDEHIMAIAQATGQDVAWFYTDAPTPAAA
jgi:transcriptional regulator with XRE-family HTH domain